MTQQINEVQGMLYQIHSMADLLVAKYQELVASEVINEKEMISSPILSIAEIITEKAEACLDKLNLIESSINEEKQKSTNSAYTA